MINNIKISRKSINMTQEELARICDVSLRQIQNIESGVSIPRVDLAIKIKKALNVKDIEDLFVL